MKSKIQWGEIESDLPVPRRPGGRARHPMKDMKPGDSAIVKGLAPQAMQSIFLSLCKRMGWKGATRQVEGGVRVWRLS